VLREEKPVLHVLAEQEKNRVEHYVPLHPSVVGAISEVLENDLGLLHDFSVFAWLQCERPYEDASCLLV